MNLNDCTFKMFRLRWRHLHSDQYFVAGLRARQQCLLVQMRPFENPIAIEIDRLVEIAATRPLAADVDLEGDPGSGQVITIQGLRYLNPATKANLLTRRVKRDMYDLPVSGFEIGAFTVLDRPFVILPVLRLNGIEG